ncbi:hypothetical protein HYV88_01220 [Candidatus Woesearchaeota archaeon]|nr:hypothetical protein [Candidatus Woesearchaeota archaeon]
MPEGQLTLEEQVDFEIPKREYVGMADNTKVRVIPVFDHLFLSRTYREQRENQQVKSNAIKVSWRFNKEGRIDLVDYMLFSDYKPGHVLVVNNYQRIHPPWLSAEAIHYPLPEETSLLNRTFRDLPFERKYEHLLRYGHSTARHVIECINTSNISDSTDKLKLGQESLLDIAADPTAIAILSKAGELLPFVETRPERKNRRLFHLVYEINQR